MTIQPEEGLRVRIVDAVRPRVATRIYPLRAPQNVVRPYVVYRRISGNPERHMRGAAKLASARIQVESIADDYATAKVIADDIRVRLDGFKGEVVVGTGTFHIRHLSLQNDLDDFIEPQDGSDVGVYRVLQDWSIFYVIPATSFT